MKRRKPISRNDAVADAQAKYATDHLLQYVPEEVGLVENPQTAIPRIAKDESLVRLIEAAVQRIPTFHNLAFKPSARPWLGHLMMLEDCPASTKPVRSGEPFFRVFPEFKRASYKQRYEIMLTKLVRERLCDAACLIVSDSKTGPEGAYFEPSEELRFQDFASALIARAVAAKTD